MSVFPSLEQWPLQAAVYPNPARQKRPPGPVLHRLRLSAFTRPFIYFFSLLPLVREERRLARDQPCFLFIPAHVGQVMLCQHAPFPPENVLLFQMNVHGP